MACESKPAHKKEACPAQRAASNRRDHAKIEPDAQRRGWPKWTIFLCFRLTASRRGDKGEKPQKWLQDSRGSTISTPCASIKRGAADPASTVPMQATVTPATFAAA